MLQHLLGGLSRQRYSKVHAIPLSMVTQGRNQSCQIGSTSSMTSFTKNRPYTERFFTNHSGYIIPMPPDMPPAAGLSTSGTSTTSAPIVMAVAAIETAF